MTPACKCSSDPYTWIVDDLGVMTVCFACRTCGTTWTRVAPPPMQKQHARIMQRKAEKELAEMGYR